jgi:hypothetical protein
MASDDGNNDDENRAVGDTNPVHRCLGSLGVLYGFAETGLSLENAIKNDAWSDITKSTSAMFFAASGTMEPVGLVSMSIILFLQARSDPTCRRIGGALLSTGVPVGTIVAEVLERKYSSDAILAGFLGLTIQALSAGIIMIIRSYGSSAKAATIPVVFALIGTFASCSGAIAIAFCDEIRVVSVTSAPANINGALLALFPLATTLVVEAGEAIFLIKDGSSVSGIVLAILDIFASIAVASWMIILVWRWFIHHRSPNPGDSAPPVAPVAPEGAVGPVSPVAPVGPVSPVAPEGPGGPVGANRNLQARTSET